MRPSAILEAAVCRRVMALRSMHAVDSRLGDAVRLLEGFAAPDFFRDWRRQSSGLRVVRGGKDDEVGAPSGFAT